MDKKQELCLQCLECCKYVTFTIAMYPGFHRRHLIQYYKDHGFEIVESDDNFQVVIKTKCKQLTKNGCKIYDKRSIFCQQYDGRQDPIMKDKCKWTAKL